MSTESLGPFLKQARETQGLTLEQVASVTRIQRKYLQALEEEQFSNLPEPVFTKGFVRTYARSLGIDERDALRRLSVASNAYWRRGQQEPEADQSRIEEEKPEKSNRKTIMVLIAVVVLGFGLFLISQQEPTPSSTPDLTEDLSVSAPSPNEEETETLSLPPLAEPTVGEKADIAPTTVSPEPELPPVSLPKVVEKPKPVKPKKAAKSVKAGPLVMELEATQLTWVVVKSDQNKPKEALLQPRQRTAWKAKNKFTLTLGNAGGVRVWLNGESRGPFGRQGQIVREIVIRD